MLNDPFQVLRLQVGDAHMTHHTFLSQFHEGRQCLVDNLLQTALHTSLKLNVVHVDEVDIVHIQAFHTLIDTLRGTLTTVVPRVHAVLAVASYLRREVILVAGNLLQGLS